MFSLPVPLYLSLCSPLSVPVTVVLLQSAQIRLKRAVGRFPLQNRPFPRTTPARPLPVLPRLINRPSQLSSPVTTRNRPSTASVTDPITVTNCYANRSSNCSVTAPGNRQITTPISFISFPVHV
ncbi:hypothetical protein F2Q70_00008115 [Brassica cretica]|uniref:Uncharacterized protein n=1 Tax=Brassica cretica TaxID=69181 RepID=A0A8S9M9G8_BRACR|nr:hypothetical protein F2Q70_00008115 [Brassica cretica]